MKKVLRIARAGTDVLPQYLVLGFRYFAFNKANVQLMLGLRAHPERFGSSRSCARPPFVSQISNNQFSNAGSSHWRCFRGTLVLRRGATPGKRLTHPSLGTTACKRFQAPCSNTSTTQTGRSVREQDPPRASGPAPRTRPSTARSARATRAAVCPCGCWHRGRASPRGRSPAPRKIRGRRRATKAIYEADLRFNRAQGGNKRGACRFINC